MRHAIRDHYGSTVEVIRAEESAKKKKKRRRAPVNVCSHACHPRDLHPGGRRDADAALQDAGACNSALAAACSFFGRLYTARVLQSPQSRCVVNLCNGHSFFAMRILFRLLHQPVRDVFGAMHDTSLPFSSCTRLGVFLF